MSESQFDNFAGLYDALIDWPKRLANETPFYRALFERIGVRSVLDAACGTGGHAALFHSWGCRVEGADLSPAMIEFCRSQFAESQSLRWVVRAFDQPTDVADAFDAVVCIGNSLSLVADLAEAERALRQMLAAIRPGGVCVLQVLNLWRLPDGPPVWQKCKRVTLDGQDHILVKGVHRVGSRGFVDLIDLTISAAAVTPRFDAPVFIGFEASDLTRMVGEAGAARVQCYGTFQHDPYQREQSPDLIVVAEKG